MKVLVKFNKNIATPRQVKSFKVFNIGIVLTTINDLLDSATIEIDDQTLPILKINNSSFIEYYLINDLGLTPGYSYPYYTDDFMKEVTIGDLVLINNGQMGEENVQSDWNQINILADDFIKNKPELFSGDYNDLINTPALVTNHSELNLDDGTNPHGTTKGDVGLGNVDNTSDANKPISNATQTALNSKQRSLGFAPENVSNKENTTLDASPTKYPTNRLVKEVTDSKLDKVTTNDVEKVYIKNADGTQGMKPVSEFGGGGSVQSVTGDSVDNTNPLNPIINAIPLSGTTVGNPVTGDIETLDYSVNIGQNTTENIDVNGGLYSKINFNGGGTTAIFSGNKLTEKVTILNIGQTGVVIQSNAGGSGLSGGADFTMNITDLDYVQKKYVDTKVPKVTSSGVERAYIINSNGTQSTKPTSDFGTVKGTGTINRISKFTASDTIGDSQIFDNGTNVGIGTTSPQARLDVRAQGVLATDIVLRVRNSTDTQNFLVVNGAGDVYNNGAKGVNTNTFFGENVGRNATGGFNTAIGASALRANTTGNSNTAIGASALLNNTTGNSNTAIGASALLNNTTGNSNTAIGNGSLQNNTTATNNTAVGIFSLYSNTTGLLNTAIGNRSLQANISGGDNVAIGNSAARYTSDGFTDNTTSNNSIFLGSNTAPLANNQTNQIVIGNNAIGQGSNSVVLGNNSITRTQLRGQVIMGAFNSEPTGIEGAIYYDSTNKAHYGFDGTDWNRLY